MAITPNTVQAQTAARPASATTAFNGVYIGVSAENNSRGNTLAGGRGRSAGYAGARSCRSFRTPARLTIINGLAKAKWGEYTLSGSPTPDGGVTMTTGYGQKFEGRIDGQHRVTGRLVGYCIYDLVWQKMQ